MRHCIYFNIINCNNKLVQFIIAIYKNKVITATAKRRENICFALKKIVENNTAVELVYLVSLNPIVKNVVDKHINYHLQI